MDGGGSVNSENFSSTLVYILLCYIISKRRGLFVAQKLRSSKLRYNASFNKIFCFIPGSSSQDHTRASGALDLCPMQWLRVTTTFSYLDLSKSTQFSG